jgi:hypothetical protein
MLTSEQIQQLFVFCVKHFVRQYDVQVELVDHLANAIEDRMAADQSLGFDTALVAVHGDFGVLGFAQVVNAKAEALTKKYRKERWQGFRAYFTWPKIALTACVFLLLMLPLKLVGYQALGWIWAVIIAGILVYEYYVLIVTRRRISKQTKKLLVTEIGPSDTYVTFFLIGQVVYWGSFDVLENKGEIFVVGFHTVFALLITLCLMSMHAFDGLSRKTIALAKEKYPEAFGVSV